MRVRRHKRDAETGCAHRDRGRTNSLNKNTLLQETFRKGHAFFRITDDERLNLALTLAQRKPQSF